MVKDGEGWPRETRSAITYQRWEEAGGATVTVFLLFCHCSGFFSLVFSFVPLVFSVFVRKIRSSLIYDHFSPPPSLSPQWFLCNLFIDARGNHCVQVWVISCNSTPATVCVQICFGPSIL